MRDYNFVEADFFKEEALIRGKADIYRFLNESGYTLGRVNKSKDEHFTSKDTGQDKVIISIASKDDRTAYTYNHMGGGENINDYAIRVISNCYSIDSLNASVNELSNIISAIKEFPKRSENSDFISLAFKDFIYVPRPHSYGVIALIYKDKVKTVNMYEQLLKSKIKYSELLIKHIMIASEVVLIEDYVENQKNMWGKTYITYHTAISVKY